MHPEFHGARVALLGPFSSRDADDLATTLRRLGAEIRPLDAAGVTHVVYGRRALDVARALGRPYAARPGQRWIDEDAFAALATASDDGEREIDSTLRACVERIADGSATDEDVARFGMAVLRGARRWGTASPIAIEIPCRTDRDVRELTALARRSGEWDVLEDERGRSIVRIEVRRVPVALRAPAMAPFHQFAERALRRTHALVWIGGWRFRARTSRAALRAVLEMLASG